MTQPTAFTARETLARFEAGSLSIVEVAEAHLDAIARREPALRAFVWHEPAMVRHQAVQAAARRKAGHAAPLDGLLLGVKDVLDTADQPSQYGSPAWAGYRPRADAACVALARRAGAAVVGKTVTTELATRHPGPTRNPVNPAHTPGGSSSGSAAGVVAGFFHLAFGTQTAGSVIRPAAYCGAHGFKPGFGALPRSGMKLMSESLDTIGLLGRSLDDLALAMTALTGRDHGQPAQRPDHSPRLALGMGPQPNLASPETRALLDRTAQACRRAGATVEEVFLPEACATAHQLHGHVMNMEIAQALAWELDNAAAQLSPVLLERMDWARGQPQAKLAQGRAAFAEARAAFDTAMQGFDALLTPAAPGEAPEGLGWTGDPAFNALWTALHVPCAVFPAGKGPAGLPLGLQVVALDDAATLRWAAWVEGSLA